MNFAKARNVLSVVLDDSLQYSGDATVSYTYDDLHRLTRETCVPSQGSYRYGYDYRYSYDAVGNRTGKTDGSGFGRYETEYSYSARNELLGEATYRVEEGEEGEENWVYVGGWTYSYDLRGNMVTKGDPDGYWWWVYTWSADDKLLKREFHDDYGSEERTKVEYKYDLLGRRIAKRVTPAYGAPGPWRWYFYDGLQVTAEGTGTNDKMYYTHSPSPIGGIIARDNNGAKLWYHFDRLGNVMAVTDSNGNPYAVYGMEAFGYTLQMGSSTGYAIFQPDPQPYHLTTKEYDPDTGLYYFNARWYDATTGRFLSPDERGHAELSGYAFVADRPTRDVDADGMKIWLCSRRSELGIGNHCYMFDDRSETQDIGTVTCGMGASRGGAGGVNYRNDVPTRDSCAPVPGSEGKEDMLMNCCEDTINKGLFFPGINDCHEGVKDCLCAAKLPPQKCPGRRVWRRPPSQYHGVAAASRAALFP